MRPPSTAQSRAGAFAPAPRGFPVVACPDSIARDTRCLLLTHTSIMPGWDRHDEYALRIRPSMSNIRAKNAGVRASPSKTALIGTSTLSRGVYRAPAVLITLASRRRCVFVPRRIETVFLYCDEDCVVTSVVSRASSHAWCRPLNVRAYTTN